MSGGSNLRVYAALLFFHPPGSFSFASMCLHAVDEQHGAAMKLDRARMDRILDYPHCDHTQLDHRLTAGYGFNRYYSTTPQYSNGFDQTNGFGGAGFPSGYVSQLQSKTLPTVTLSEVIPSCFLAFGSAGAGKR
jgi:hypothetical protein